ncbi:MAG: hypothetical protein HY817_03260 [Candidatus Abawacabacteria bacterium]|nr:hypothetical protein [Candidatus Abawacabacteria bacterium]
MQFNIEEFFVTPVGVRCRRETAGSGDFPPFSPAMEVRIAIVQVLPTPAIMDDASPEEQFFEHQRASYGAML